MTVNTALCEISWNIRLQKKHRALTSISFAGSQVLLASNTLCETLSDHYEIPPFLWTNAWQRSNGSFGCQVGWSEHYKAETYTSWNRFLVKQLLQAHLLSSSHLYEWYEMTFITHLLPSISRIVLCLDVPPALQPQILTALSVQFEPSHEFDAYSMHVPLIYEMITLYDKSVWDIRDAIRTIEKAWQNRITTTWTESDFRTLHDLVRHSIHSSETLEVALNTVLAISAHYETTMTTHSTQTPCMPKISRKTQSHLASQVQLLRGLGARSRATESRLRNEINLGFNLVAQRDSKTMVRVSDAARTDSAATKTIAILTLIFLPATFLSSLFSMSFFNFSPADPSGPRWTVSSHIWLYWVFAIPLTLITMTAWTVWGKKTGFLM